MRTFRDFLNHKYITEAYDYVIDDKTGKIVPLNSKELKKLVRSKNTDLSKIDISRIYDLSWVFEKSKRTDFSGLETWDVSHVKNVEGMFAYCDHFTGKEVENWNTSNFENIRHMFAYCKNFNANLSRWKTTKVKWMEWLFESCSNFTGKGLETWDVSKIKSMYDTFFACKKLNGKYIEKWNLRSLDYNSGDPQYIFAQSSLMDFEKSDIYANVPKNFLDNFMKRKALNPNND